MASLLGQEQHLPGHLAASLHRGFKESPVEGGLSLPPSLFPNSAPKGKSKHRSPGPMTCRHADTVVFQPGAVEPLELHSFVRGC